MKKRIIYEIEALYRDNFRVTGFEFGEGEKSVCIVGSMRGNEVQQLYVCSQLVKKFKQLEEESRIKAGHKILIIPSINPYSMNIQKRFCQRTIPTSIGCTRDMTRVRQHKE